MFTHSFKRGGRREWDDPGDSLSGVYLEGEREDSKNDRERKNGREKEAHKVYLTCACKGGDKSEKAYL